MLASKCASQSTLHMRLLTPNRSSGNKAMWSLTQTRDFCCYSPSSSACRKEKSSSSFQAATASSITLSYSTISICQSLTCMVGLSRAFSARFRSSWAKIPRIHLVISWLPESEIADSKFRYRQAKTTSMDFRASNCPFRLELSHRNRL